MRLTSIWLAAMVLSGVAPTALGQATHQVECTILGELTRQHTFRRLSELLGQTPTPLAPGAVDYGRLQICDETVVSVSTGFSAAMAQFGMPVRWGVSNSGSACNQNDIQQCFPYTDPASAPLTADQLHVMQLAWREVRNGTVAHMPWGAASNVSYFSSVSLLQAYQPGGPLRAGSIAIEPAAGDGW
ncbi:MAG: hypothetical protein AAGA61_02155 [Pseudomonadota bacterium]